MSTFEKAMCYILSFFIPFLGIILFLVWIGNSNGDKRRVGRFCLFIWILSTILSFVMFYGFTASSFQLQ